MKPDSNTGHEQEVFDTLLYEKLCTNSFLNKIHVSVNLSASKLTT